MPISRLESSKEVVDALAATLLESSRALGSPAPATLPEVNTWAYGDLIMVLGTDLRADAATEEDLSAGLTALTSARQQLP